MGRPPSSDCNCHCSGSGYVPPVASGRCCYYIIASGSWYCLDYVSEAYCLSLPYGNFGLNEVCGGYDCTACFVSGTMVTTDHLSYKDITSLCSGDTVVSIDGKVNNVLGVIESKLGDRRLVSIDGNASFVTEDHPFVTDQGLKAFNGGMAKSRYPYLDIVGSLKSGDNILTHDGKYALDKFKFKTAPPSTNVYTLNLDGDNLFFANGFAVHNKSLPPTPPTVPDPPPAECGNTLDGFTINFTENFVSVGQSYSIVGTITATFGVNYAVTVDSTTGYVATFLNGNGYTSNLDILSSSFSASVETIPVTLVGDPDPCRSCGTYEVDPYTHACSYIKLVGTITIGGIGYDTQEINITVYIDYISSVSYFVWNEASNPIEFIPSITST